jgi:alpha-1,6-mannosyltransferase
VVLPVFALCTLAAGVSLGWLPALSASSVVVEWISIPTAVGQLSHTIASGFTTVPSETFMSVARLAGWLVLIALVGRQWWRARSGQPTETIRRAAVAMLIVALFSPATLPWYFSWALILSAGLAWSGPRLVLGVFGSVWITLITYPTGTSALYDWAILPLFVVLAGLTAVSLLRPDPLGLKSHRPAAELPQLTVIPRQVFRPALGEPETPAGEDQRTLIESAIAESMESAEFDQVARTQAPVRGA